jgi:hypothetical protein
MTQFEFDVFLSHSAADKPRVRALAERLVQAGMRIWLDDWNLRPGEDIYLGIERGMRTSRLLVLCMSPAAFGSEWVSLERSTAAFRDPTNRLRRFVPILLADCDIPETIRRYKYVDYRQNDEAQFGDVLAAVLDNEVKRKPSEEANEPRSAALVPYLTWLEARIERELGRLLPRTIRDRGLDHLTNLHRRIRLFRRDSGPGYDGRRDELIRLREGLGRQQGAASTSLGWRERFPDETRLMLDWAESDDLESQADIPFVVWDGMNDRETFPQTFRHLVLLGDPGAGKSWCCRFLALWHLRRARTALSEGRFQEHRTIPLLVRLPDLCSRLTRLDDDAMERALVDSAAGGAPVDSMPTLLETLRSGRVVLILDGWDEIANESSSMTPGTRNFLAVGLRNYIDRYLKDSQVLLASRVVGYSDGPGFSMAKEAFLLPFQAEDIEAFATAWFGAERSGAFLAQIRTRPQLLELARVPVLLTLMCRTAGDDGRGLPSRRSALYRKCLVDLLRDVAPPRSSFEHGPFDVDFVLRLLRRAAAYTVLITTSEGPWSFTEEAFREALRPLLGTRGRDDEFLFREKVNDLLSRLKLAGILASEGPEENARYLFLHRSFHEYLVAEELSARWREAGWQGVQGLLTRKTWDPEWDEIVVLLAGLVDKEVKPLLELIDSRLSLTNLPAALGLMCIAEAEEFDPAVATGFVERWIAAALRVSTIIRATWSPLIQGFLLRFATGEAVDSSLRRLATAALSDQALADPQVAEKLLKNQQDFVFLRPAAGLHASFAERLLGLLKRKDVLSKREVGLALRSAASSFDFVRRDLLHAVADSSLDVATQEAAVLALRKATGQFSELPPVLLAIADDRTVHPSVRRAAIEALHEVTGTSLPIAQALLATLIRDVLGYNQTVSSLAFVLGQPAAHFESVATDLLGLLGTVGIDHYSRSGVVFSLRRAAVAWPSISRAFLDQASDKTHDMKFRCELVAALGQASSRPEVERFLLQLVGSSESDLGEAAIGALRDGTGNLRDDGEVARALTDLLQGANSRRLEWAAVGTLVKRAAPGSGLWSALASWLRLKGQHHIERMDFGWVLSRAAAFHPEVRDALLAQLSDRTSTKGSRYDDDGYGETWRDDQVANALGRAALGDIGVARALWRSGFRRNLTRMEFGARWRLLPDGPEMISQLAQLTAQDMSL